MHHHFLRADGGSFAGHGMRRRTRFLFLFLLIIHPLTLAGPFEQGMKSLENGDFAEAYCLWRPLAMRGHTDAAYHLGWLYANGNGLKVDVAKAVYWWTQAANEGHTDAQFALGLALTNGEGVEKDPLTAAGWFLKAALAGNEDAREIIRERVRSQASEVRDDLPKLISQEWLGRPVRVTADNVNLRSGPGTENSLVRKVEKNTLLIVIHEDGRWYQVIDPASLEYSWVAGWLTEPAVN